MGPGADTVACSVPRAGSGGERKTDVAGERRVIAGAVTSVWERGWASGSQ